MAEVEKTYPKRKTSFFNKTLDLARNHNKVILVDANNVGSFHLQRIRRDLRTVNSTILMGKNTLVRKAIRSIIEERPDYNQLLPHIVNNVGLVFTNNDLSEVKKIISDNRVAAPAKAGAIAPCTVTVPAGPTGLEPTQTAFLQALSIATRIQKGQIHIMADHQILTKGDKVDSSSATLLAKLKIFPFAYGLDPFLVFDDGFIYDVEILDKTDDDILAKFCGGVSNVACIALAVGIPSIAAIPHSIARAYKNILAVSVASEYTFDGAKEIKELLSDPEKMAAAAAAASSAPAASSGGAAAEEEKPAEEEEEESEGDMGFGLFD